MNIFLFTDYGMHGPYQAELGLVARQGMPGAMVVDLFADVPAFSIEPAAHLLAAYASKYAEPGSGFLAVVDPGVGTDRRGLALCAEGAWYVGPDNGLLEVVGDRAESAAWYELNQPEPGTPNTFHGRDWFAPALVAVMSGYKEVLNPIEAPKQLDQTDQLHQAIYIDGFGNVFTGIPAGQIQNDSILRVKGTPVSYASTFADASGHKAFWHINSIGLVEIACNQASAAERLNITVGDGVIVVI